MRKTGKSFGAALAAAVILASGLWATDAKADSTTIQVDLTEETPTSSGEVTVGGNVFDGAEELLNSLSAMNASGQITVSLADPDSPEVEMYIADLDKDGSYDIAYTTMEMMGIKAVTIVVLPTRSITDSYDLTLNDASLAKVTGSYAKTLRFIFPPKHVHKWGTQWQSSKDGHFHACSGVLCPSIEDKQKDGYAPHIFGAWKVTKNATKTDKGSKERSCSVCGYKETKEISAGTASDSLKDSGTDGKKTKVTISNLTYKINGSSATFTGTAKKKSSITIPATIKSGKKTYKVTAIAAGALKNNKTVKSVKIGKNVKTIGKSAFAGCKNLKNITIQTTSLTKKTVGADAFKNISAKAKIKVPGSKRKEYKSILKKCGVKGKKQSIK